MTECKPYLTGSVGSTCDVPDGTTVPVPILSHPFRKRTSLRIHREQVNGSTGTVDWDASPAPLEDTTHPARPGSVVGSRGYQYPTHIARFLNRNTAASTTPVSGKGCGLPLARVLPGLRRTRATENVGTKPPTAAAGSAAAYVSKGTTTPHARGSSARNQSLYARPPSSVYDSSPSRANVNAAYANHSSNGGVNPVHGVCSASSLPLESYHEHEFSPLHLVSNFPMKPDYVRYLMANAEGLFTEEERSLLSKSLDLSLVQTALLRGVHPDDDIDSIGSGGGGSSSHVGPIPRHELETMDDYYNTDSHLQASIYVVWMRRWAITPTVLLMHLFPHVQRQNGPCCAAASVAGAVNAVMGDPSRCTIEWVLDEFLKSLGPAVETYANLVMEASTLIATSTRNPKERRERLVEIGNTLVQELNMDTASARQITCAAMLRLPRPSTARIGFAAMARVVRRTLGLSENVVVRSVRAREFTFIAFVDRVLTVPNTAVILHLPNHYALIFGVDHRSRSLLTARKGQLPRDWITWNEIVEMESTRKHGVFLIHSRGTT